MNPVKHSTIKARLTSYQELRRNWSDLMKSRAQLRRTLTEVYESNKGYPHIHNAEELKREFPHFLTSIKGELREQSQSLWKELASIEIKLTSLSDQAQVAESRLTQLVEAGRAEYANLLTTRWSAMSAEVVELLTPYCSTPKKAKELSRDCDKLDALEREINAWRGSYDLEMSAERLLLLDNESAPEKSKSTL